MAQALIEGGEQSALARSGSGLANKDDGSVSRALLKEGASPRLKTSPDGERLALHRADGEAGRPVQAFVRRWAQAHGTSVEFPYAQ
jgi:hypothetical protein